MNHITLLPVMSAEIDTENLRLGLAGVALGALCIVMAVLHWRGKVGRGVPMWQGPGTGLFGGLFFLISGVAATAQALLGQPEDWWLLRRAIGVGLAILFLTFPYIFWYNSRWYPNLLKPRHERVGRGWNGRG